VIADEEIDRELNGDVVLEGAQGVLLDQDVGVTPPHVTWSHCTSHAAHAWLDAHGSTIERTTLGVMRTYATRHGQGPFPTEAPQLASLLPEAEAWGTFQGAFRVGHVDLDRLRYAIAQSPVDALVVTHLDRLGSLASHGGARTEDEWLAWIARELRTPVAIASRGPRASDKRWLSISS
jgi:adenylosuccinate synthase